MKHFYFDTDNDFLYGSSIVFACVPDEKSTTTEEARSHRYFIMHLISTRNTTIHFLDQQDLTKESTMDRNVQLIS
jgi:hypothetical protein